MAHSGVTVEDACVHAFELMKTKRAYKFVTFMIQPGQGMIVVDRKEEHKGSNEAITTAEEYQEFYAYMKSIEETGDCRYAVYDLQYETSEGGRRGKLAFIHFCPDAASIKKKMLYASSKDALKDKLIGTLEIQASDLDGIELEEIRDKCLKTTTYK